MLERHSNHIIMTSQGFGSAPLACHGVEVWWHGQTLDEMVEKVVSTANMSTSEQERFFILGDAMYFDVAVDQEVTADTRVKDTNGKTVRQVLSESLDFYHILEDDYRDTDW